MNIDPLSHKAAQLVSLAIQVDRLAYQLDAEPGLASTDISGGLYLLHTAVENLESALHVREEVLDRRVVAEHLEAARLLAGRHAASWCGFLARDIHR